MHRAATFCLEVISMNHTIRPILVILYALLEIITGGDER